MFSKENPTLSPSWEQPPLSLLDRAKVVLDVNQEEIQLQARLLTEKLEQFAVQGQIKAIKPGPAVTLYEFQPNANIRLSKITDLAEDISMALSSESVRIIAPIPGRDVVGIEVANRQREKVYLREMLESPLFLGKGPPTSYCFRQKSKWRKSCH